MSNAFSLVSSVSLSFTLRLKFCYSLSHVLQDFIFFSCHFLHFFLVDCSNVNIYIHRHTHTHIHIHIYIYTYIHVCICIDLHLQAYFLILSLFIFSSPMGIPHVLLIGSSVFVLSSSIYTCLLFVVGYISFLLALFVENFQATNLFPIILYIVARRNRL